jgi:V/A-type H+-transporting ATPase subunit I
MLVAMTKVEIVGHRRCLDDTLTLLQRRRVIQMVDATFVPGIGAGFLASEEGYLHEAEELRLLRNRIDALLELVAPVPAGTSDDFEFTDADLQQLWPELDEVGPQAESLVKRIDALDGESAALPRHVESLRRLLPLIPEWPELKTYETVALLLDRRHAPVVALLREELALLVGSRFEVISGVIDPNTIGAVLVFPAGESRRVHSLLSREQVSRVRLPDRYRGMPLAAAIAAMERRIIELPAEIEESKAALHDLLGPRRHWHRARIEIDARLARLDGLRRVGATESTFVIIGWVPERAADDLAVALDSEVGPEVILVKLDAESDDRPPVLLSNPKPARPFEMFVGMLAMPRYGTIDPTVLMALFLPLFFGIMLGDIAYGLILFLLASWAGRRWGMQNATAADLFRILRFGSAWAMVWGVIFGEAFGDLGRRLIDLQPLWIDREEAIEPLLLFAVAIGAAHVVLGLVLGILVSARIGDRRQVEERAALLGALCALFALAGIAANRLPAGFMTPAIVLVVIALVVLVVVQWPLGLVMGPLGLMGAISNVLSYLRIAAIGLASVFLARVGNELGASAPLWLGLAIASLFHALNLALGAFSPTIQALRLHYVEFFDKFFEPGGESFEPFGSEVASRHVRSPVRERTASEA